MYYAQSDTSISLPGRIYIHLQVVLKNIRKEFNLQSGEFTNVPLDVNAIVYIPFEKNLFSAIEYSISSCCVYCWKQIFSSTLRTITATPSGCVHAAATNSNNNVSVSVYKASQQYNNNMYFVRTHKSFRRSIPIYHIVRNEYTILTALRPCR